jgi:hypothetical protein
MKRIALVLVMALSLGACQTTDIGTAIKVATVGVANPVSKQDLYTFENGMIIAFAGLNAYKRACLAKAADANCVENIRSMQVYTRQLPGLLRSVRAFVKSGDRVNAATAYQTLLSVYGQFKALATSNGVKVS